MRGWMGMMVMAVGLAMPVSGYAETGQDHLEKVLTAAGWTMTPERAATYTVGDVYRLGSTDAVLNADKCFTTEARSGKVEGFEILKSLEGGLRLPILGRVGANAKKFRMQTFGEPYADKFDDMDLEGMSEKCRSWLKKQSNIGELYVVKSVLMAMMREQLCTDAGVSAGTAGVSVGVSLSENCVSGTQGHVAVAYKLVPVTKILGLESAPDIPVASGTGFPASVPLPVAAPVANSASAAKPEICIYRIGHAIGSRRNRKPTSKALPLKIELAGVVALLYSDESVCFEVSGGKHELEIAETIGLRKHRQTRRVHTATSKGYYATLEPWFLFGSRWRLQGLSFAPMTKEEFDQKYREKADVYKVGGE